VKALLTFQLGERNIRPQDISRKKNAAIKGEICHAKAKRIRRNGVAVKSGAIKANK